MAKQGGGKLANSLGSFFGVTRYGSETEELSEGMQDVHSHDSTDEASIPSTETPAPSPGIRLNALPTPASANPDTAAMPQATGAAEPLSVESEAITASSAYQTSAQRQETNQFAATYTPIPHREQKTNREEYQVQNHYETDEYPYPSSGYDQVHELDVNSYGIDEGLGAGYPYEEDEDEWRRMTTIHPRSYNDAKIIGEAFRENIPVIMNVAEMSDSDAKRLVDFASGLAFGLSGRIERVTGQVFLLTPENLEVLGADTTPAPGAFEAEGPFPFDQG